MNRRMGGYTLIELAIIIVVVSILAGLTFVGGERFLNRTRAERLRADVATLSLKLERYYKYNSVSGIGHEYPSCADLIKNFSSIVGDDSLKKEKIKCIDQVLSDADEENNEENVGKLFYMATNIYGGDCTKPDSGFITDVAKVTCVEYTIFYLDRWNGSNTLTVKEVESIWHGH